MGGPDVPGGLDVATCEARCDADAGCLCVTYNPSNGKCWKRRSCVPESCDDDASFDTYMKRANYTEHDAKNCFEGHGGHNLEPSSAAPAGLTVDACQARCDADSECGCVTFRPSNGKCWKRAACEANEFADDDQYVTYVSSRAPAPMPDTVFFAKVFSSKGPLGAVAETCVGSAVVPDNG